MTKKKIRFSPTNNSKVTFEGNKYTNTFEFPIFGGKSVGLYWQSKSMRRFKDNYLWDGSKKFCHK